MHSHSESERNRAANPAGNRGVALIVTLLLLSVLSLIGLTMVLTSSTDMMINGYYRNYRGAFYAADSGMNVARQQLLNQVLAAVPSAYVSPPIAPALTASFLTNVMNSYSSFTSINTGQASGSWSGAFEIANTATCTNTFGLAAGSPTPNVVNNSYN
jgi:Tfp pilus assembly protein PilX